MQPPSDQALDTITALVQGWVETMRLGNMPAVDLADMRTLLSEGGRGIVAVIEVVRPATATDAVKLAIAEIDRQISS